jgi:uncharacterized protein
VQGYCDYIVDFVASLHSNANAVRGVAYLHNAAGLDVDDLTNSPRPKEPGSSPRAKEAPFWNICAISSRRGRDAGAADRLLSSAVHPSKHLLMPTARRGGNEACNELSTLLLADCTTRSRNSSVTDGVP